MGSSEPKRSSCPGAAQDVALGIERAALGAHEVLLELVERLDAQRAGGGEVAEVGEVGALVELQAVDGLRNQKVDVGVSLPVAVRGHVDGHVVDEQREVGAVIGVEAADQVLHGLAAALMLVHHQAGNVVQNLLRRGVRTQLVVAGADLVRRRRRQRPLALDHQLVELQRSCIGIHSRLDIGFGFLAGRARWRRGAADPEREPEPERRHSALCEHADSPRNV